MRKYFLPGVLIFIDILALVLTAFFSLYLRFDALIVNEYFARVVHTLPLFIAVYLLSFNAMHLYTRIWKYAGTREVAAIVFAATVAAILFRIGTAFMGIDLPRSFYIISYMLMTGFTGMNRLFLHYILLSPKWKRTGDDGNGKRAVLIVGAGDAGSVIAREIVHLHTQNRKLTGFIDDDKNKRGRRLDGIRVLGNCDEIPDIVQKHGIQEIIIAIPSAKPPQIRRITNICAPLKCKISILPGIYQLLNEEVSVQRLRSVSIEDLLQRDEVHLDKKKIQEYLEGKCVLVSGAGGSIGSEICRQIMQMNPAKLILLGHGENSIYMIHRELMRKYGTERLVPVIADVRDGKQLDSIFEKYHPQAVFHAAAHKHVPLMEVQPMAAVLNNIYGTRTIAEVSGRHHAERFVMISTDKAVNPTSVMGATKQVAEKVVQIMNHRYDTKYITVRFGNVLGSRGSVIPLFERQLAVGGPLTVTDPRMTRYFMTIPEASQLVLQAGSMGQGGEVFLLDMGEPVKIMDLARNMIRLSGMEPDVDIQIKITGMRPGEKLYEELLTAEEGTRHTNHKKIFTAKLESVNEEKLCGQIDSFEKCRTQEEILAVLQSIIPTYHPNHNPKKTAVQKPLSAAVPSYETAGVLAMQKK